MLLDASVRIVIDVSQGNPSTESREFTCLVFIMSRGSRTFQHSDPTEKKDYMKEDNAGQIPIP